MGIAYLLWFFLGVFGAHRFYTRAGRTGWWLLGLHLGGWVLLGAGFFAGADTVTEHYQDAFGFSQMTSVTSSANGGVLALLGQILRGAAWAWWLVDIVLVPGLVQRFNARLAATLGL